MDFRINTPSSISEQRFLPSEPSAHKSQYALAFMKNEDIFKKTPTIIDSKKFWERKKSTAITESTPKETLNGYTPILYRIIKKGKDRKEQLEIAAHHEHAHELESKDVNLEVDGKRKKTFKSKNITIGSLTNEEYAKVDALAIQTIKNLASKIAEENRKRDKESGALLDKKTVSFFKEKSSLSGNQGNSKQQSVYLKINELNQQALSKEHQRDENIKNSAHKKRKRAEEKEKFLLGQEKTQIKNIARKHEDVGEAINKSIKEIPPRPKRKKRTDDIPWRTS